jgi:cytochrome c5
MLNIKTNPKFLVVLAFGGLLAGMVLYGCKSDQNPPAGQSAAPATQPVSFALFGPPPQKSGVQLWSDNCARCHNSRPPNEFSAAQWDAIVHHMQLRANLTGEEARAIVKFLQASN